MFILIALSQYGDNLEMRYMMHKPNVYQIESFYNEMILKYEIEIIIKTDTVKYIDIGAA